MTPAPIHVWTTVEPLGFPWRVIVQADLYAAARRADSAARVALRST